MKARSSRPNESVVPPSNQQIPPALDPASTMPACHALRMITSSACTRHTAAMFATLPPPTKITSDDSNRSSGSRTFGIGNSERWLTRAGCPAKRSYMPSVHRGSSPAAVFSTHSRGSRLLVSRSALAMCTGTWPSGARMPPPIAMMCRRPSAAMPGTLARLQHASKLHTAATIDHNV